MQRCSAKKERKERSFFVEKSERKKRPDPEGFVKLKFYSGDAFQNRCETIIFFFLMKEALIELVLG